MTLHNCHCRYDDGQMDMKRMNRSRSGERIADRTSMLILDRTERNTQYDCTVRLYMFAAPVHSTVERVATQWPEMSFMVSGEN